MSPSKHTPGPWATNRIKWSDSAFIYGADGYGVADINAVHCHKDGGSIHDRDTINRSQEEMDANARLIAATPDLLLELEREAEELDLWLHDDTISDATKEAMLIREDKILRALRRATPKPSEKEITHGH